MKHVLSGLVLIGAVSLVGCSSTGDTTASDEAVKPELLVTEEASESDASTSAVSKSDSASTDRVEYTDRAEAAYTGHPLDNPNSPLISKIVYFDFDKSMIKDEDKATLNAHADYLINNPAARVRLEGHADERGTREYNVALGERRAAAVHRYLTLKGVSFSQINTISYGEERPARMGHDESSWSLNRRVELVYTKR